MKNYPGLGTRGLVITLAVASAALAVSLPSYASINDGAQIHLAADRYHSPNGYAYGRSSQMRGTISRVDYGQRSFRLYMNNGQSYHVDASNAAILVDGSATSFRNLPGSGAAMITGFINNRGDLVANEVQFGRGRGTNGYNNGYNNRDRRDRGYRDSYRGRNHRDPDHDGD